jgi:hypothetical protein
MLKVAKTHTCVVFSPADGKIHHVHKEVTLEGAQVPSEAQIEAKVRELATRGGRNLHGLRIAFVEDTRSKEKHYRVDPQTLQFVEVPRPNKLTSASR